MISSEVRDGIDKIKKQLIAKHSGETFFYTACNVNCGATGCVIKVRLKDGKITAIEPDDRYNTGIGREDEVISDLDIIKNHSQARPCVMGLLWHDMVYSPNRILYPMKRVEGSKRGEGKFERISWDEALTIIANKMKECKEKYGPYSIIMPYMDFYLCDFLFGHFGCGVAGWGFCSDDAGRLAKPLVLGFPGFVFQPFETMADMLLNTKMILLFGADVAVSHWGGGHTFAYFIKMAREKGVPVIYIDPRYTSTAEMCADQWIPIKPGTDMAMMLAMAYVLFKEDLYNKEFVEKWVEPDGFKVWRNYVMGMEKTSEFPYYDGVKKSPEWAEKICGVPAETITELARLYAKMKPTYLVRNWSISRKSGGVNVARAAMILQSIMGYIAMPGGSVTFVPTSWRWAGFGPHQMQPGLTPPIAVFPRKHFPAPRMYRNTKWAQAVLLLNKVEKGEMTTEEYRRIIGWRCDPSLPNPNPKMLIRGGPFFVGTNYLVTCPDSTNDQIKALENLELVVHMGAEMNPTAKYSDIILPIPDMTFEEGPAVPNYGYGGYSNMVWCPAPLKAAGEAKHAVWIFTKIAEKLGFAHFYNTYYTTDENWEKDWDRYMADMYRMRTDEIKKYVDDYGGKMTKPLPTWEEFKKKPIINVDEFFDEPWHALVDEVDRGKGFPTKSGKIEFWSYLIADESRRGKGPHMDSKGRMIDGLPNDWCDLSPIAIYQPCVHGMEDPLIAKYPLMLLTSHSRYRVHSFGWTSPRLRSDCYRHSVWLSIADAKDRGINDGDLCRVYNDYGQVLIPAHVTSTIMPGVTVIRHGAYYDPDPSGLDRGGCATVLLHDDKSQQTPAHVTTCVQVEKYRG